MNSKTTRKHSKQEEIKTNSKTITPSNHVKQGGTSQNTDAHGKKGEKTTKNHETTKRTTNYIPFAKGNKLATVNKGKPQPKTVMKQLLKAVTEQAMTSDAIIKKGKKLNIDFTQGLEQFIPDALAIIGEGIRSKKRKDKGFWITQTMPYIFAKRTINENLNKNMNVEIHKSGKKIKDMETEPQENAGEPNE